MISSPALASLPFERVEDIHKDLMRSYDICEYAILFLRKWLASNLDKEPSQALIQEIVLSLIASKRFVEAEAEIENSASTRNSRHSLFNFLMAEWGIRREIPHDKFKQFVTSITDFAEEETDANTLQCFSLAYWASGDLERAMYYLAQALQRSTGASRSVFSCWAYLYRSPRTFRADLEAMKAMYLNGLEQPEYIGSGQSAEEIDSAIS